jgi:hypothetical protein
MTKKLYFKFVLDMKMADTPNRLNLKCEERSV